MCFKEPRGNAALISQWEERLELWGDIGGSRNPQGGSASCKAKMHLFQGAANYSPCQHLCTWEEELLSEIHHEFSWQLAFLLIRWLDSSRRR